LSDQGVTGADRCDERNRGRAILAAIALCVTFLAGSAHRLVAAEPVQEGSAASQGDRPSQPLLAGPALVPNPAAPSIEPASPTQSDQVLPINLATALYLSNARPLVIASAQASVEQAAALLLGAKSLWLPDLHFGMDYFHHSGLNQSSDGSMLFANYAAYEVGGGATLSFGVTDAVFQPLAARQQLLARQWDVQTARNDALLSVAQYYFDVQEARGRLAGSLDSAAKTVELVRRIESLTKGGFAPGFETDRARSVLADLEQQVAASRTTWRVASARLTRALRLNPSSVTVPLEPPHLEVTLIASQFTVDDLIPCGLMNRPELASQRAVVQATLELLRQERLRPLLPSVVLEGTGPGGALMGGLFGGGQDGGPNTSAGRSDVGVGLVWTLNNLGLGNRALVRGREADQQKALLEFFNIQDQVAQDIVQAQARVEGARDEIRQAEIAVQEAKITYEGTMRGLSQPTRPSGLYQLISRPQEAVAAVQQLSRAYDQYFIAINGYNRAEFELFHAMGYPSRILAWERRTGDIQPIDTTRRPEMAPVCPHVLSSPER
jgi:outer membrane protein TolC